MTKRELPPPFTLTDAAREHVARFLAREPEGSALRVDVSKGGCSGFEFAFSFAQKPQPGDRTATVSGLPVFISMMAEANSLGATLDLVSKDSGTKLAFTSNPSIEAQCGCGESFQPKQNPTP